MAPVDASVSSKRTGLHEFEQAYQSYRSTSSQQVQVRLPGTAQKWGMDQKYSLWNTRFGATYPLPSQLGSSRSQSSRFSQPRNLTI
jgi:hypothetical protein